MSPEEQDASSRLPSQIDQIHEAEGLIADHPTCEANTQFRRFRAKLQSSGIS